MARLRSVKGCPWDRAQTHASLKKYLIEEAYEVCDVIDAKNPERLKDELGDLLFQALFHARIAEERGLFNIYDVLRASYRKMLRRHPHVFGKHKAKNPDEAYRRWNEKKDREKSFEEKTLLRGVPKNLPALLKAQKVSKRASWAGFDASTMLSINWPDTGGVVEKIGEELKEIKKALKTKDRRSHAEEIGDMLFAVVNLARFLDIDAEEALNRATKKFTRRFKMMEENLTSQGKKIGDCGPKELDCLWELHKRKSRR